MPIYEFKCMDCGNVFEELVMDGEDVKCPSCGSSRCEKLISAPAFKIDGRISTTSCCGAAESCGKSCRSCK